MHRLLALLLTLALAAVPLVAQEAVDPPVGEADAGDEIPFEIEGGAEDMLGLMMMMGLMGGGEGGGAFQQMLPMLLMGMMGEGDESSEEMKGVLGMMMMSQLMAPKSGGAAPVVVQDGERLLIVENGTVYRVNLETLTLEGQVQYREDGGAMNPMGAMFEGMMGGDWSDEGFVSDAATAEERAAQLGAAARLYAEEHNGRLPGRDWTAALEAYGQGSIAMVSPADPLRAVGYALNARVAGLRFDEIAEPGATILFFESLAPGDRTVAGSADVDDVGYHDGQLAVVYVDGTTAMLVPEEARRQLLRNVRQD